MGYRKTSSCRRGRARLRFEYRDGGRTLEADAVKRENSGGAGEGVHRERLFAGMIRLPGFVDGSLRHGDDTFALLTDGGHGTLADRLGFSR